MCVCVCACQVILEAGDALFVPRHWWHYVECLEPAVSVNTWIDLVYTYMYVLFTTLCHACGCMNSKTHGTAPPLQPSDSYERVKEAVVRTMVAGWLPDDATDNSENQEQRLWVNPNEVYTLLIGIRMCLNIYIMRMGIYVTIRLTQNIPEA